MALSLQSRAVGDVTVVTCGGRIVEGAESAPLQTLLNDLLTSPDPYIVLDLAGVDFIDSAGLGLLVRFLTRIQAARGRLLLCAVPPKVTDVLRISRLAPIFESYATEADAIAASYRPAPSANAPYRFSTDILCVEKSVDVQCYVRELLAQAGYGVMTAGNLPDALVLLQATRPKLVVIGSELRASRATETAERFNRLADTHQVIELPAGFGSDDAGAAGERLIAQVRDAVGEARGTSPRP